MCSVCGKRSSRKYDLKVHMRTHTGARPYRCRYCHKTFVTSSYVKVHERQHAERGDEVLDVSEFEASGAACAASAAGAAGTASAALAAGAASAAGAAGAASVAIAACAASAAIAAGAASAAIAAGAASVAIAAGNSDAAAAPPTGPGEEAQDEYRDQAVASGTPAAGSRLRPICSRGATHVWPTYVSAPIAPASWGSWTPEPVTSGFWDPSAVLVCAQQPWLRFPFPPVPGYALPWPVVSSPRQVGGFRAPYYSPVLAMPRMAAARHAAPLGGALPAASTANPHAAHVQAAAALLASRQMAGASAAAAVATIAGQESRRQARAAETHSDVAPTGTTDESRQALPVALLRRGAGGRRVEPGNLRRGRDPGRQSPDSRPDDRDSFDS